MPGASSGTATERSHALALQLLKRHGVVLRETLALESIPGGFSAVYPVLKAFEESGRVRRGYFIAGLGGAQFALPAAVDLLRSLRAGPEPDKPEMLALAATDPANLYGSVLRWPSNVPAGGPAELRSEESTRGQNPRSLSRAAGASVVLRNGDLVAYLRRNSTNLIAFLPAEEPARTHAARDLGLFLAGVGQQNMRAEQAERASGMLIATVNDVRVDLHFMARFLLDAGFQPSPAGFNLRRVLLPPAASSNASVSPEVQ